MGRTFTTISRDTRDYTPKEWLDTDGKPEDKALVFKFKPLSKRQIAKFADNSSRMSVQNSAIILGTSEVSIDVFRVAITGWENFFVDEKEYKFKKEPNGLVDEEVIDILPLDIIEEVANHIIKVSKFPEEEKGN